MANENKDVIRAENTTVLLPAATRNGQTTYENDGMMRQLRALLKDGTLLHWTPDEFLTAALSSYTNGTFTSLSNVKNALDFLLSNVASLLGALFYFRNENTVPPITNYLRFSRDIPTAVSSVSNTTALAAANTEYLLKSFASDQNDPPGGLASGQRTFFLFASTTATSGTTNLVIRGYKRTSGGTETEVYNGVSSAITSSTAGLVTASCTLSSAVSFATTDCLVVKVYAKTTLSSNPSVTFYYGGDSNVSFCQSPTTSSLWGGGTTGKLTQWLSATHLGDSPLSSPDGINLKLLSTLLEGKSLQITNQATGQGASDGLIIGINAAGQGFIKLSYETLGLLGVPAVGVQENVAEFKNDKIEIGYPTHPNNSPINLNSPTSMPNLTASKLLSLDANKKIVSDYGISSGTFTLTWQNFDTTITSSVAWQKIGKHVTMIFDAFAGNAANSNLFYATGMPTDLCPLVRTPSGINMYSGLLSGAVDNNGTRENGCYAVIKHGGQIAIMLKSNSMFAPGARGLYVDWPSVGDTIYGKITISYMMDR